DMSELTGSLTKAENEQPGLTIPSSGVLPGTPKTEINVVLEGDGNDCSFKGNGETDYCTYSYSGKVTEEKLEFNLTDVRLKNTTLAGTWTLPELYQIDPDWPEYGATPNIYNVARIEWQSEKGIEIFPGYEMPIASILGMTLMMPMVGDGDAKVSPVEMLAMTLKSVTFHEDGNVTACYVNASDMSQAPVTSPSGIAQYAVTSEGNLRLFLNPAAIIANTVKAAAKAGTRATDISLIVEGMMQQLIPMLTQGVPVSYGKAIINSDGELNDDPDTLSFYLGTETLLPLLKTLMPLLSDEEFINGIVEEASKDPDMGSMAGMLPQIFSSLPGIIETTTKIEIGINLKK
ncbi:MAG: DUF4925 domain-containing protein, partial [Muribaculaceae bacterium]|nr:DUF4925 domain-containing protein [Muribaculaceae bacterium]